MGHRRGIVHDKPCRAIEGLLAFPRNGNLEHLDGTSGQIVDDKVRLIEICGKRLIESRILL